MKQKTIKKTFELSGLGLHSGKEARLSIRPTHDNAGIIFVQEGKKIPARLASVKETKRGTTLEGIAVVEHLLSAVYALGIDNLIIEVAGKEVPTIDGSALPFYQALARAEIVEQKAQKEFISLSEPVKLCEGGASIEARPYRGFKISFVVNFAGIGEQSFCFDLQKDSFEKEIAPARTLGNIDEYELLKEQGLALGANMQNALVLGKDGYINTPRFLDEPVRHKILDLIGDLCLLGKALKAEVVAEKSGHKLNIDLIRRILKHGSTGH